MARDDAFDLLLLDFGLPALDGLSVPRTLRAHFLRHHDQVLSREQLLSHASGYQHDREASVVDVHVDHLRRKVGRERIATVRGMGCALQADGAERARLRPGALP